MTPLRPVGSAPAGDFFVHTYWVDPITPLFYNGSMSNPSRGPNSSKPLPLLTEKQTARFWKKVAKAGEEECWNWTGAIQKGGYGTAKASGVTFLAHRMSFQIAGGALEPGAVVAHRCDNTKCVNPNHLFSTTQKGNVEDSCRKGRFSKTRGEMCHSAKLTGDIVLLIRSEYTGAYGELVRLSSRFGVAHSTIKKIVYRKTWKHL